MPHQMTEKRSTMWRERHDEIRGQPCVGMLRMRAAWALSLDVAWRKSAKSPCSHFSAGFPHNNLFFWDVIQHCTWINSHVHHTTKKFERERDHIIYKEKVSILFALCIWLLKPRLWGIALQGKEWKLKNPSVLVPVHKGKSSTLQLHTLDWASIPL